MQNKTRKGTAAFAAVALLGSGLAMVFGSPQAQAATCTQYASNPTHPSGGIYIYASGGHNTCAAGSVSTVRLFMARLIGTNPVVAGLATPASATAGVSFSGQWSLYGPNEYYTQTDGPAGKTKSSYITFKS